MPNEIPAKANRILNFVFIVMLLIGVRLWQISVLQHDEKVEAARKPQQRSQIIPPKRGTIRDRFNIPLAQNRIQYNACVSYALLRQIPTRGGRRVKHIEQLSQLLSQQLGLDCKRVEDLIHSRAALLPQVPFVIQEDISEEVYYRLKMLEREWVGLCAECTSRRIYPFGRVAGELLGYMGAIAKEQYEAHVQRTRKLETFLAELDEGQHQPFPEGVRSVAQARHQLMDLRERAYSLRDRVGRSGVEAQYDELLRGFSGTRTFQVDLLGNCVRQLPGGKKPIPGKRILLSLSAELQLYAEQLLAQNERLRDGKSYCFDANGSRYAQLKQPWIKGGAIVVLEPNKGEVLAMASYPRVDPNVFVDREGREQVAQWFEDLSYVGAIWDGKRELTRENYLNGRFEEERLSLTFRNYLEFLLPQDNPARQALERVTIADALLVQEEFDALLERAASWHPRDVVNALWDRPTDLAFRERVRPVPTDASWRVAPESLEQYVNVMTLNYDKLLFIDLCRLFVDGRRFSKQLRGRVGQQALSAYADARRDYFAVQRIVQEMAQELYREDSFKAWRELHESAFLKEKRKEEAKCHLYQRPYLDYLDAEERRQFEAFWSDYGFDLVALFVTGDAAPHLPEPFKSHFATWSQELHAGAHQGEAWCRAFKSIVKAIDGFGRELAVEYFQTFRCFNELDRPLLGFYRYLRKEPEGQFERHLAAGFYPKMGFGYGRSWAHSQAVALGSIFKIVPALTALQQRYEQLKEEGRLFAESLNPLTMIDDPHKIPGSANCWNVGFTLSKRPIPQIYKGGKMLRTHRRHTGEIDLVGALETSSNAYFALLAVDHIEHPDDIKEMAYRLGFGQKTGIDLPGEFRGQLPEDLAFNRTGLYAFTAGQHSLVVTPLQTATMLATLANGGRVLRPHILRLVAGTDPQRASSALFSRPDYPYRHSLNRVGLSFGLFTSLDRGEVTRAITAASPEVVREVAIAEPVRDLLLEGLRRNVIGDRGKARPTAARGYHDYPWMIQDYRGLREEIIGKTSTAETVENVNADALTGTNTYNHLWFAAISFEEEELQASSSGAVHCGRPELVVVIYLRYGDYGREAAPLAGSIVKKWREIKASHAK